MTDKVSHPNKATGKIMLLIL